MGLLLIFIILLKVIVKILYVLFNFVEVCGNEIWFNINWFLVVFCVSKVLFWLLVNSFCFVKFVNLVFNVWLMFIYLVGVW